MKTWLAALGACVDILFTPGPVLARLAANEDWRPAAAATALTSLLFAGAVLTARALGAELTETPPFPLADYRLWETLAMPALVGGGTVLAAAAGALLGRLIGLRTGVFRLWRVLTPALLAPLWPMLWPTDLAVALGALDPRLPGFPGFWVRELAPALTVLFMLMLLVQAYWRIHPRSLREAFGLAVFSLLPGLGWWAYILR